MTENKPLRCKYNAGDGLFPKGTPGQAVVSGKTFLFTADMAPGRPVMVKKEDLAGYKLETLEDVSLANLAGTMLEAQNQPFLPAAARLLHTIVSADDWVHLGPGADQDAAMVFWGSASAGLVLGMYQNENGVTHIFLEE